MRASDPPLRACLAAVLAASILAVGPRVAAAQQPDGEAASSQERGWIGVGLQETLVCPRPGPEQPAPVVSPEECRRTFVAEAVVEDGPADRAGVRPGDTLVAVNGRPVASRRGARVLRSLRPGRPVELLIGRDGGRESLTVEPGPRPRDVERMTLRTPLAPAAGSIRVTTEMVRRWSRVLGGVEAPDELTRGMSRAALRVDRQGRVYLQGEGEELVRLRGVEAGRIRALHDSVMEEVRRRLRHLRREAGRDQAPDRIGVPDVSILRAAGAEFRQLTPGLAAHFEGVDRGLLVLRVVPGTPAEELGLRPGDVVVEAGGRSTLRPVQLQEALEALTAADSVVVRWIREGETKTGALGRP